MLIGSLISSFSRRTAADAMNLAKRFHIIRSKLILLSTRPAARMTAQVQLQSHNCPLNKETESLLNNGRNTVPVVRCAHERQVNLLVRQINDFRRANARTSFLRLEQRSWDSL